MGKALGRQHWPTVVIGGGQAGLATGYHLAERGEQFVVLDRNARPGDSWRQRWDSLRLFTPARHNGLPGMPFPAEQQTFPSKDEVADYLEAYASRFSLPVLHGVEVERLDKADSGYALSTSLGRILADRVVVATGTNQLPRIPSFARELDPAIRQLHSSQYRNPADLGQGAVLVVGAGTSGVELAVELAASRKAYLSGRPTRHIPDALLRYAGEPYWWFVSKVLTVRTPIGRRAQVSIRHGGAPLIRVSVADLKAAGVEQVARVVGVADGRPRLDDGRTLPVSTVLWATGYQLDFEWIRFQVADDSGFPDATRGVSNLSRGLYFVGMPFQYALVSGLLGGVDQDAAYVADQIHRQPAPPRLTAPEAVATESRPSPV